MSERETGRILRGRVVGEVCEGNVVEVELLDLMESDEFPFRVWPFPQVPAPERCTHLNEDGETRCDGKWHHRARFHWHIDTDTGDAVMWLDTMQAREREGLLGRLPM